MVITKRDTVVIMDVITAYVIITAELNKQGKEDIVLQFKDIITEWIEPRSSEFKNLFADTSKNLAERIAEGQKES